MKTGQTPEPGGKTKAAALNDNAATDRELDQFYTVGHVATYLYGVLLSFIDAALYLMVEPSAGTGAFFRLLPPGSLAWDIDPKYPGIATGDFLTITVPAGRRILVVGNPPFGRNASLAVRFFNHAAWQADVIAFIVPRSFRKPSIENRLDRAFRLLHEEVVADHAFLFRGTPYDVSALFQIWVRGNELRALRHGDTTHPDFTFVETADLADFAIRRVGAKAGKVHRNMTLSDKSNYFIKSNTSGVEAVMRQLDFASAARNVSAVPSLAKTEVVALYKEYIEATGTGRIVEGMKDRGLEGRSGDIDEMKPDQRCLRAPLQEQGHDARHNDFRRQR